MYFSGRKILKAFFIILILTLAANSSFAETYNEDAYFKDYVSKADKDLVIAVNRDTGQVEFYWSDTYKEWLKPGKEEQPGLQRLYNKKAQLRDMQGSLDRMHDETWYNTDQNIGSRRGRN